MHIAFYNKVFFYNKLITFSFNSIKIVRFSVNVYCFYHVSIFFDLNNFCFGSSFFILNLGFFVLFTIFIWSPLRSWHKDFWSVVPSSSDFCPGHQLITSLALYFIILVIFLAELRLAFNKIENILISALINFCFLLSGLAAPFFILSFICSNSFSTRSLMVSLKPSTWSTSVNAFCYYVA